MLSPQEQSELKSCPLLEKLSAELRNEIWELAFTPDHEENEKVELFEAKPPQKSLLLACRQIYHEAKGFYLDAYRSYWPTTKFVVGFPPTEFNDISKAHFSGQDVDQINHLQIARVNGPTIRNFIWDQGRWAPGPSSLNGVALRVHFTHNPRSKVITTNFSSPASSEVYYLHKQLLLSIASITEGHEGLKTFAEPMDYLGHWGSLNKLK